jgi:hypothetical protein
MKILWAQFGGMVRALWPPTPGDARTSLEGESQSYVEPVASTLPMTGGEAIAPPRLRAPVAAIARLLADAARVRGQASG